MLCHPSIPARLSFVFLFARLMSPYWDLSGHATDWMVFAAGADMALSAVHLLLGDFRAWHDR
jgi:hypothetical protein